MKLISHTDGGARGNPGPAAIGVVIKDAYGKIKFQLGEKIGIATNNTAEYRALIAALKKMSELNADEAECIMDSKLVVEQMNGHWKIKEPHLQRLFVEAWNAASKFKKTTFKHVPREKNTEPDKLLNIALDSR